MRIDPETLRLEDGRALTLRSAGPEDSAEMIEYLRTIYQETHYLTRWPEEMEGVFTLEKEQAYLGKIAAAPDRVMLTLFDGAGRVAGNAGIHPHADTLKERHRAELGIALIREYWHQRLGSLLMDRAVAAAREMGYEQVELSVFSGNHRAISLYRRKGFAECGRTPRAFRLKDGSYEDDVLMYLPLK